MREKLRVVLRNMLWPDWPTDKEVDETIDAILEAMMEPSGEMAIAGAKAMEGWDHTHGTVIVGQPKEVWQAMLKAIKEK